MLALAATGWTSARAAPPLLPTVELHCWTPVYMSGLEARPRPTGACIHSVTVADDRIKIKFLFFRNHVVGHHPSIYLVSQERLRDFREHYNIALERRPRHTNTTVCGIGVGRISSLCVVPSEATPPSDAQTTSSADFKVIPQHLSKNIGTPHTV